MVARLKSSDPVGMFKIKARDLLHHVMLTHRQFWTKLDPLCDAKTIPIPIIVVGEDEPFKKELEKTNPAGAPIALAILQVMMLSPKWQKVAEAREQTSQSVNFAVAIKNIPRPIYARPKPGEKKTYTFTPEDERFLREISQGQQVR